jgi:hypothetical protein
MHLRLLPPQKTRRGKTLMQKRIGNSITIFFMFHKTPQQVLAKYESHFGTGFVSTTIEINMLAKLNNMLNLLKQSGE